MTRYAEEVIGRIQKTFPDMSREEVKVEFLTQLWLSALKNSIVITVNDNGQFSFTGVDAELPDEAVVSPKEFYKRVMANIFAKSIEQGFVYVVNVNGSDYEFLNAHEISIDDFFLRAMPREEAIQFALNLVDDKDSV